MTEGRAISESPVFCFFLSLVSCSLHLTTFCLQYRPTVVACVCIHLACKWSNWEIPISSDGKHWWEYLDPTVTLQLLDREHSSFKNTSIHLYKPYLHRAARLLRTRTSYRVLPSILPSGGKYLSNSRAGRLIQIINTLSNPARRRSSALPGLLFELSTCRKRVDSPTKTDQRL